MVRRLEQACGSACSAVLCASFMPPGNPIICLDVCIFSPKYRKIPEGPLPPTTPKYAYGTVVMKKVSTQSVTPAPVLRTQTFCCFACLETWHEEQYFATAGPDVISRLRKTLLLWPCEKHISSDFHWIEPGILSLFSSYFFGLFDLLWMASVSSLSCRRLVMCSTEPLCLLTAARRLHCPLPWTVSMIEPMCLWVGWVGLVIQVHTHTCLVNLGIWSVKHYAGFLHSAPSLVQYIPRPPLCHQLTCSRSAAVLT